MYKSIMAALTVAAVVTTTGCAGFKANSLPKISEDQLKSATASKVKLYSSWEMQGNGQASLSPQISAAVGAIHKKNFDLALQSSGCCVLVEGPSEADVVVKGKFINENNPAAVIPAFITGFSLFTVPSWATSTVHLQADAVRGGKSYAYDVRDSMKMVTWLPMLLVMPFVESPNAIKAEKEVTDNTYRNLVAKMQGDGVLK